MSLDDKQVAEKSGNLDVKLPYLRFAKWRREEVAAGLGHHCHAAAAESGPGAEA